jgi:hypothetical protein
MQVTMQILPRLAEFDALALDRESGKLSLNHAARCADCRNYQPALSSCWPEGRSKAVNDVPVARPGNMREQR